MSSSELAHALNYVPPRPRQAPPPPPPPTPQLSLVSQGQAVVLPSPNSHQDVAQPSELPVALTEPLSTPLPGVATVSVQAFTPIRQQSQGAQIIMELARRIAASQKAHEQEVKRRLEWEKGQEEKYIQKQVELEKTIEMLHEELKELRSTVGQIALGNQQPSSASDPDTSPSPSSTASRRPEQTTSVMQLASPVSPRPQPPLMPMFVQGSSRNSMPSTIQYHAPYHVMPTLSQPLPPHFPYHLPPYPHSEPIMQTLTPNPSPHLATAQSSTASSPSSSVRPERCKKRMRSPRSEEDGHSSSNSDSSRSSAPTRPSKRTSHHDTRCYTIHHALRIHILRLMDLESDKHLPDSHVEGTQLGSSDPVRFAWDKTTKQSVHNARMKARILDDIKERRWLYKHVSSKDFAKKVLDNAFEQCFVTLRQKFKAQRNDLAARELKKREDSKARKARHVSRRKIKLNNRSEARNRLSMFEHVTFDGALQVECMSSEESDNDDYSPVQPSPFLGIRGYAWRSKRLVQFYCTLDEDDKDSSTNNKRIQGKKERRVGVNKEEFILPPQGIATWMVSKRWYNASLASHPDLPHLLKRLIVDPIGFDWSQFHFLGEESSDEEVPFDS